jgi:hypothetical protein
MTSWQHWQFSSKFSCLSLLEWSNPSHNSNISNRKWCPEGICQQSTERYHNKHSRRSELSMQMKKVDPRWNKNHIHCLMYEKKNYDFKTEYKFLGAWYFFTVTLCGFADPIFLWFEDLNLPQVPKYKHFLLTNKA